MMTRISFLLLFFVALISYSPAQANGVIEFFFPMLKKEKVDPAQTLQAPFMKGDGTDAAEKQQGLPENAIPLNLPHRNPNQVSAWLMANVSEVMSFKGDDHNQEFAASAKYFDKTGQSEYMEFLTRTNIIKVLESRRYRVQSFVEGEPLLLNKGEVGGRYKWLFEVPLMVSYLNKGVSDYRDQANEPVTQNITLNIQVGRIPDSDETEGVVIERWSGKVVKSSKNQL